MEKVWKIEINSEKMVKSLEIFIQIYNKSFCEFFSRSQMPFDLACSQDI